MTKQDYLNFLGYNTSEYTILSEEEVKPYLEEKHMNYVYGINDPKGKKLFGKHAKIVSLKWKNDIDAKKGAAPSIPEVPKMPSAPKMEIVKEEVVPEPKAPEQPKTLSNLLKSRIFRLQHLGWKDEPSHSLLSKGNDNLTYDYIEEMENDEWDKYILTKKEVVDPGYGICDRFYKNGEWCKEQCFACSEKEPKEMHTPTEQEIIEEVKPIIEVESFDGKKDIVEVIENKEDLEKDAQNMGAEMVKEVNSKTNDLASDGTTTSTILEEEYNVEKEQEKELNHLRDSLREITTSKKKLQSKHNILLEDFNNATERIQMFKNKAEAKPLSSIETTSKNNFFQSLNEIGFSQLNISVNKLNDDKIAVIIQPKNTSGDPAYDNFRPITVKATARELDKDFFEAIKKPVEYANGLMTDAEEFIKEAKVLAEKTKAAEAVKTEVKKLYDAAKKYQSAEKFDATKTASYNTATKKWNAIIELDAKNKLALEGLKELAELKEKGSGQSDLTVADNTNEEEE